MASWLRVVREGEHVCPMERASLTITRAHPINALYMGGVVRDDSLTAEEFKKLL